MHTTKLFVVAQMSLLSHLALATVPSTCQYKVFVDGYPNSGCVVANTGLIGVNLADSLFLAPGDCRDTPEPILSFRDAISNDAKAPTCTLMAYSAAGCQGSAFTQQPHVVSNENQCVEYALSSGNLLGARSFSLKC